MDRGGLVIEFLDRDGRLAALVRLPERAMFWSEGRFERGEVFGLHEEFFGRLEELSRRFQGGDGDTALAALEGAWQELNERFVIRDLGSDAGLADVGLHLDGHRARARWPS